MTFALSNHQNEIRAEYALLGQAVAAHADHNDSERSFDFENWRRVCEAGIWRLPVPKQWGGRGGSWTDCVAAMEGIATTATDLGFLVTMLGHVGALRVLLEEGTGEQKERWLEPIMQGRIGITAMTEATGGSDLARMKLGATPEGSGWRLSGSKVHITNAPVASLGMVAGRIPSLGERRDITLFFLDLNTSGIVIGQGEDNLGIRTSPTADIVFENVAIEQRNIIGRPGDGLRILYRVISFERALYGVIAAGLIDGMIAKAMQRIEARRAFNKPLADFQYVQGRVSDMVVSATVCRLLTYSSLEKIDDEADDASAVCSVTKLLAGENLLSAAEHLVQLHGHLGFMNNSISRQLRDAVGMRIAGGTSDIQRINIFQQVRRLNNVTSHPMQIAAE